MDFRFFFLKSAFWFYEHVSSDGLFNPVRNKNEHSKFHQVGFAVFPDKIWWKKKEKKKKYDETQVLRKSLESNFMANKRGNLLNALKRANVKEIQDIRKKLFIQIK